jgi:hypothetical protein
LPNISKMKAVPPFGGAAFVVSDAGS